MQRIYRTNITFILWYLTELIDLYNRLQSGKFWNF